MNPDCSWNSPCADKLPIHRTLPQKYVLEQSRPGGRLAFLQDMVHMVQRIDELRSHEDDTSNSSLVIWLDDLRFEDDAYLMIYEGIVRHTADMGDIWRGSVWKLIPGILIVKEQLHA